MNIVLFGFMGTGKSAVAQVLARRLNLRWQDMDKVIEGRLGSSIEGIFEKYGEAYFRQLERELVQELVREEGMIVSTGGGVVLDDRNIADFQTWGLCICLNAGSKIILERTRFRQDRPLLKGQDPMKKIRDLLELRRPFYQKIQNQLDTTDKSVHDVVETILSMIEEYKKLRGTNI